MDGRGAPYHRHHASAGDNQVAVLNDSLSGLGIDAWQRDQRQNLSFGF